MDIILVVLLLLLFTGSLPIWGYHGWGWGPSGILGVILGTLLILLLLGRL